MIVEMVMLDVEGYTYTLLCHVEELNMQSNVETCINLGKRPKVA